MNKRITIFAVLVLLAVMVIPAAAQSLVSLAPGTWTSSINIQNVGNTPADVVLTFYNAAGAEIYSDSSIMGPNAIPVGGSRTIVLSGLTNLANGEYSVMVSSSSSLEVIANSSSKTPVTAGAYQGVKQEQLGTILYFPGLYKAYYNFNSEIVLQNTDSTVAASVKIEFFDQVTGNPITGATLDNQSIPANATRIFALPNIPGVPTGTAGLISARVTSKNGQPLAGVANIWTPYKFGEFGDYNAYLSGATKLYVPALYKNYYNFVSSLTIMNLGTVNTDVEVTYSNGVKETVATLKPFQAIQYYQPGNAALPSGNSAGVFSATVQSKSNGGNPAQPIVAIINVEDKNQGLFGSYKAPAASGTTVGCPVVMQNYYGWFSAETVQNVGTLPTSIKVTYASGQTVTFTNIPANGTKNIVEMAPGSALPGTSSVSAKIESVSYNGNPAQPLVVIVQENSLRYSNAPGDYLLAYTCVAQ
jgi:hypothetical protein